MVLRRRGSSPTWQHLTLMNLHPTTTRQSPSTLQLLLSSGRLIQLSRSIVLLRRKPLFDFCRLSWTVIPLGFGALEVSCDEMYALLTLGASHVVNIY
ncbi:hypothetical protein JAAARDRAFT_561395 [Jaapia argillacea MUCL 33604]|uniref:Uncharacterized protein n=1 Tax=Jaapia argillacea MUCL 33604 TaxID=933084 RepID=A0A067Q125_9AGAM|nr:hypothetical protein JAAARDRAFT_561395 [Jaapia argillacea MUCL 33604]